MSEAPKVLRLASGKWPSILVNEGLDEKLAQGKHGPCPSCGGKDRFRIIKPEAGLRWICNQCGTGDGMDLFMVLLNTTDFYYAAKRLEEVHGQASYIPPPDAREEAKKQKEQKKRLVKTWNEALTQPNDLLDEYLQFRGLRPESYRDADLRLHPRLGYWDDDGKYVGAFPAMLARIANRKGELCALHRTYLFKVTDGDWRNKKKITANPKSWSGGAMRLLPSARHACLIIGEGIESTLSLRQWLHDRGRDLFPCWASVSARNLEDIALPEHLETVVIAGDNDRSYTGQRHSYALANRLKTRGPEERVVAVLMPTKIGDDWNDALRRD